MGPLFFGAIVHIQRINYFIDWCRSNRTAEKRTHGDCQPWITPFYEHFFFKFNNTYQFLKRSKKN